MGEFFSSAPAKIETSEEIAAFKAEIASIFDERFSTLGHGTRLETAKKTVVQGLEMKVDKLQTTTIPIENNDEDIRKLLHWPHHNAKGICIIMIPKDLPRNADILESIGDETGYGNGYRLPPRFVKGYIDVAQRKFFANDQFEENPSYTTKKTPTNPLENIENSQVPVDVPTPSSGESSADIF